MGLIPESKDILSNPITWLRNMIRQWGLEVFAKRFYGIYRGKVIDVNDPDKRLRCRVMVPAIGHSEERDVPKNWWAKPCLSGLSVGDSGSVHGDIEPPNIGDEVWVVFEHGNPEYPVYLGGWIRKERSGAEFEHESAKYKGIRTSSGHFLRFSDEDGNLHIILARGRDDGDNSKPKAFITLDKHGSVLLSDESGSHIWINKEDGVINVVAKDGSFVTVGSEKAMLMNKSGGYISLDRSDMVLSAPGNIILSSGGKVSIDAGKVFIGSRASEPAVRGMKLVTNLATHIHITPGFGAPSSPQTTPPPMLYNELSEVVSIA